jgi:monothiol glutaredoxin|tara:strand:- start:22 stop:333 length:312 start_codon:yes stop_codon:yes gene_type:complete
MWNLMTEVGQREREERLMEKGTQPAIIAYLNPFCPWTRGVVSFLEKRGLDYEYRDIMQNPDDLEEMVARSGQHSSPCVQIDGHMLADVSGEEVEAWMRGRGLL